MLLTCNLVKRYICRSTLQCYTLPFSILYNFFIPRAISHSIPRSIPRLIPFPFLEIPELKRNAGILQWMKVGSIPFFVNQMFYPICARGPLPESCKASFSWTNQTAKKRRIRKKRVKIFLNFTFLHETQPGQKTF